MKLKFETLSQEIKGKTPRVAYNPDKSVKEGAKRVKLHPKLGMLRRQERVGKDMQPDETSPSVSPEIDRPFKDLTSQSHHFDEPQ